LMERKELLQVTDIGRDRFDLRFGQAMRNRLHDGRCVWFCRILTAFLLKDPQCPYGVGIKLTCQTGKWSVAFSVRAVTGRARRDIGAGNSVIKDFFSGGDELLWSAAERWGIEIVKIRGK